MIKKSRRLTNRSIFAVICILMISCNQTEDRTANFNSIVSENAALEKVTEGYTSDTAGSPFYMNGALYFTNNNFDSPVRKTGCPWLFV